MKIGRIQTAEGSWTWAGSNDGETWCELSGDVYAEPVMKDRRVESREFLAPVVPPSIFCIGLNYRAHAEEMNAPIPDWPVVFMKGQNAVQAPGAPILIPSHLASTKVDYEAELVVVLGKACKNVSRANALEYVLGYTCGNDVSARDWQKEWGGGQWSRAKTFDTFAPMGPYLVTPDELGDPGSLALSSRVNGEVRQSSTTSDMIFDVPALIEFLSGSTTLLPGTVIFTGTPPGVGMVMDPPGWLQDGDTVEIEVEGIGTLQNPVLLES